MPISEEILFEVSIFISLQVIFAVTRIAMGKDGVLDLLSAENKLDGSNNYPLWSYMMKHILVANGLSKIVEGTEVRPGTCAKSQDDDSATTSTITYGRRIPPPPPVPSTEAQQKWDEKDAKAHAMISLSVKTDIIPHIRSF